MINIEVVTLVPMVSHTFSVHAYTLSLTAGTSGPLARTCTHRSQSEAIESEAIFSPASRWWPQSGQGREVKEELRRSYVVQRMQTENPRATVE